MSAPLPAETPVLPGATYRFVVATAEEAVQTIRLRLGEEAKVLSVRQVAPTGFTRWFRGPRLEVVAQAAVPVEESPVTAGPVPGTLVARSEEAALPSRFVDDTVGVKGSAARVRAESAGVLTSATRLPELMRKSGFSENLIGRLSTTPLWQGLGERPLHQVLVDVGRTLRQDLEKKGPRPLPARTAFLGTTGVGRTAALCKWLARDAFARGKQARVVKAEFGRPNPAEGLVVFCEALGIPVEHVTPEVPEVNLEGAGAVYADLPPLSLQNPQENRAIAEFLDGEEFAGRVLVLNAAYDPALLRKAYAVGRDLKVTHLVFTHLDEVEHWGKLWDFLLDAEVQPLFLATGPSLTGDCEENVMDALMRRTLPGG